tara:strand:+ start:383 stop:523 length:141 start_codon:yes stop_codon:yes gene_type:complete
MTEALKALNQLTKDLESAKKQIEILKKFLDPFTVAELENMLDGVNK